MRDRIGARQSRDPVFFNGTELRITQNGPSIKEFDGINVIFFDAGTLFILTGVDWFWG